MKITYFFNIINLLSKVEENLKIAKNPLNLYFNNLLNYLNYIMNNDNKWLLMTYYCPTHGSEDRCEPLQISQNELKKVKSEYHNNLTKDS